MERTASFVLLVCLACWATSTQAAIVHQGCYVNAYNLSRALPFKVLSNGYMTPDFCRRLAINRYATAFGLEWGRECWMDPDNSDLATITRFGATDNCTMPCTGDTNLRCGGNYVDDVYTITDPLPTGIPSTNISHIGCFRDDQLDRRMTLLWVSNSSMSIDLCASIAYKEEWPVFAVQWSRECWGGQDVNSSASLGPSTNCDMPCPGNTNQTCGGALALNIYEIVNTYWKVADYESPWSEPKPVPSPSPSPAPAAATPSLLTAGTADCAGAAASSPACRAREAGASSATSSVLAACLAVVLALAVL